MVDGLADSLQGSSAFFKKVSVSLEVVRHAAPHIKNHLHFTVRNVPGEALNHVKEYLPAASLQIEGRKSADIERHRRDRLRVVGSLDLAFDSG